MLLSEHVVTQLSPCPPGRHQQRLPIALHREPKHSPGHPQQEELGLLVSRSVSYPQS